MTEDSLLDFVSNSFSSIWPLELLLFLRQEPRQAWPADALVRELRASLDSVTDSLLVLRTLGFVGVDDQAAYRFQPHSPELDQLALDLSDLYSRKPRAVMRAILAAPNDRIRTFADAFRIRKDPC